MKKSHQKEKENFQVDAVCEGRSAPDPPNEKHRNEKTNVTELNYNKKEKKKKRKSFRKPKEVIKT